MSTPAIKPERDQDGMPWCRASCPSFERYLPNPKLVHCRALERPKGTMRPGTWAGGPCVPAIIHDHARLGAIETRATMLIDIDPEGPVARLLRYVLTGERTPEPPTKAS